LPLLWGRRKEQIEALSSTHKKKKRKKGGRPRGASDIKKAPKKGPHESEPEKGRPPHKSPLPPGNGTKRSGRSDLRNQRKNRKKDPARSDSLCAEEERGKRAGKQDKRKKDNHPRKLLGETKRKRDMKKRSSRDGSERGEQKGGGKTFSHHQKEEQKKAVSHTSGRGGQKSSTEEKKGGAFIRFRDQKKEEGHVRRTPSQPGQKGGKKEVLHLLTKNGSTAPAVGSPKSEYPIHGVGSPEEKKGGGGREISHGDHEWEKTCCALHGQILTGEKKRNKAPRVLLHKKKEAGPVADS